VAAEKLTDTIEIYRFKETGITFSSVCVLVYEGDTVVVKALRYKIDRSDVRELIAHLLARGGVIFCDYERRKKGRRLIKTWRLPCV